MEIRTRLAPSPTGHLHLGTARTGIFNFLFARKNKGRFILRIEDTDEARSKKEFEDDIVAGLLWLGIAWDEFYRQSERKEVYRKYLNKMLEKGLAYVSKEEGRDKKEVIRFKNPGKKMRFRDIIRGEIEFETKDLGDFVIAKDELTPLFHFAVVVDDAEMKISHVIRGEDHISNTPRQILIQEALGFSRPEYAHLPLILGPDRSKLSKRHGAQALSEYREMGYLPEAVFNFLVLLGWHPKDDREIFSKEELVQEFSLERVQKGGAVFNIAKLDWMNSKYIQSKSPEELIEIIQNSKFKIQNDNVKLEKVIALEQPRLTTLSELAERTAYFFKAPEYPRELLRWKGEEDYQSIKRHLERIIELMPDSEKIMAYAEKEGRGEVLWPLRVALSGREASPGPLEIMEALGKEETIRRINRALEIL